MRQSGYTLIELMAWCALSAILLTSILSISTQLRNSDRVAAEYVSDLTQCRRALHSVEWDVRCAKRVETTGSSVRIHGATRSIDYALENGVLTRTVSGITRAVARRIQTLTAHQTGRTVAIHLTLLPRRKHPNTRQAALHSRIHLRQGGHP
jgi:Tfp pilus assembly protein PilE